MLLNARHTRYDSTSWDNNLHCVCATCNTDTPVHLRSIGVQSIAKKFQKYINFAFDCTLFKNKMNKSFRDNIV